MPSKDSNGKPLSGAALRKRGKQKKEALRHAEKKRKQQPDWIGLVFENLPPPDLEDPGSAIAWWNRVLLVCADQVLRDPVMTLEQKIRYLHDGAAKAGMIRDKATEQENIKRILAKLEGKKSAAGLEDVSQLAAPTISRRPC